MEEVNSKKIVTLKSLTTEETLSLSGPNEFTIGLTADEKLTSCQRWSDDSNNICLSLFNLTIWQTEGCSISPSTKDLPCMVNDDCINSETNLITGSKIEIGDKLLEFVDGPITRRRQLPPTPGVHIRSTPPSKPTRSPEEEKPAQKDINDHVSTASVGTGNGEASLSGEWSLLHPPTMEEELINQLHTPEQIANLSASYLNRQIHIFTDTKLNPSLVDQIFKTFQDVAVHRRDILENFLRDFAKELAETPDGEKGKPFHKPVISLLVEILKQFLDPLCHVLLCLQLLRSISHIANNLHPLINLQTTAAILGSMTAYLNIVDVQLYSLDILVKIATYKPAIAEKLPLHEGGIEVISLSVQHHSKNLGIVQSGCRVLSNLSTALYDTASQIIDDGCECSDDILHTLDRYIVILDTISWSCSSIIQEAMKNFSSDLSVKVEGRRFLYVFARLPHLKQRKSQWYEQCLERALNEQLAEEERDEVDLVEGILKRTGSFEHLRTPDRKVQFVDGDELLSSIGSSTFDSSIDDNSGIEVCSRVFYDAKTGQPLNGDIESDITNLKCEMNGDVDYVDSIREVSNKETSSSNSEKKKCSNQQQNFEIGVLVFDKLSTVDIKILIKLLKAVVVCEICSQAFEEENAMALKLLDQPMINILSNDVCYDKLQEFVKSQYNEGITLMDFDSTVAISVIDAVRYRSVAFELIQGLIKSVVKLFEKNIDVKVLKLCCQAVTKQLTSDRLKSAILDASFCEDLKKYLLSAVANVQPGSPIDDVITHVIKLNIQINQI